MALKFNPLTGQLDQVNTGDLVGPASATDNTIARFDGTTGKLIQNSTVTISDTGKLTVPLVGQAAEFGDGTTTATYISTNGSRARFGMDSSGVYVYGGASRAFSVYTNASATPSLTVSTAGVTTTGNLASTTTASGGVAFTANLTDTSGTVIGINAAANFNPASTSSAQLRALTMSTSIPITNSQTLTGLIYGGWFEARYAGSGSASTLIGSRSVVVLPGAAQNFGTITTAYGLEAVGLSEFASSAITSGTITTVAGLRVAVATKSSAGLTVTNNLGLDVGGQTVGSSVNIGVRIALSSTYSLQLSDTGGTAAGGITFATDTNLYRSAANVLKTDDKLVATLGVGVGNSAAATTLGTVTKKMEVFDASGSSLGFVPIYDAIT